MAEPPSDDDDRRPPPSAEETPPADNGVDDNDTRGIDDIIDASLSYCSTTSAESVDQDDDVDNQEADDLVDSSPAAAATTRRRTVRTPSFSYDELARRLRSNPRTRTPLRNPSPLLGGVNRATIRDDDDDNVNTGAAAGATAGANAGSSTGNVIGSRGVTPTGSTATNTAHRVATIRLNAGLATGTLPPSATSTGRYATINTTSSHRSGGIAAAAAQRSSKQGPSHRKIRRWNNDNMVGIVSDIISAAHTSNNSSNNKAGERARAKSLRAAEAFARGEAERMEYVMPNYPLSYRSAFDELTRVHTVLDDDAAAAAVDIDNANIGGTGESGEEARQRNQAERRRRNIDLLIVREHFLRGEIGRDESLVQSSTAKRRDNSSTSSSTDVSSGEELINRMEPRIRNIVQRAVLSSPFAVRIMTAYEDVLVNRKMVSNERSAVLEEILVKPVVMKEEKAKTKRDTKKNSSGSRNGDDTEDNGAAKKVGRMVFHFHFDAEGNSAGFHRLLLHAVCQFHGMNASSTTILNGKGDGASKKERVLTVTGTCKGRQYSIVKQATKDEEHVAGRYDKSSE